MRLKPSLKLDIARKYGPGATRMIAEKIALRARALADARAKHKSVARDIDISTHAHGIHHAVILSVIGTQTVGPQRHDQIAAHLEFGYFNVWAQRWMDGLHIIRDAAFGG